MAIKEMEVPFYNRKKKAFSGMVKVSGVKVGAFLVHRIPSDELRPGWRVTHIKTGRCPNHDAICCCNSAKKLALAMQDGINWDFELDPTAMKAEFPARVAKDMQRAKKIVIGWPLLCEDCQ